MAIIDEMKDVEILLLRDRIDKLNFKEIYALCKYWRYKGKDKSQCRQDIFNYLNSKLDKFNEVVYYEKIEKVLNTVYKIKEENLKFAKVESIIFYESEMSYIQEEIKSKSARRIFFIMLYHAKLKQQMYNLEDVVWLNDEIRRYCRLAKVNEKIEKKMSYISELVDSEIISMSNSITDVSYKIDLSIFNKNNIAITIEDIKNEKELILYYTKWIGSNMIKCKECGILVKKLGNNHKHCKSCRKKLDSESAKNSMKNKRKSKC